MKAAIAGLPLTPRNTHTHTNTLKLTRPWQRSAEEVKQTLSTSVKDSTHSQTDTESSL